MKHKKLIITGLVILLLIDIGLVYASYQSGKTPAYQLVTVKRGDAVETVSSTGEVKPASQINLQFTSTGRLTDIKVKTGDKVSAGQILATLDSSNLFFQAQSAQAALEIAKAKLAQLLAGVSAEDIAAAQTAVDNAKKTLDDAKESSSDAQSTASTALSNAYQSGQRAAESSQIVAGNSLQTNASTLDSDKLKNTIGDFQAMVDTKNLRILAESGYNSLKSEVANALASLNHASIEQVLGDEASMLSATIKALNRTYDALASAIISGGILSQTDLDTYRTNIATARINVSTALTNVVTSQQDIASQKITNQTNLNAAQATVAADEGSLAAAKDQLALKMAKPRQSDIDLYRAQVAQAQANLNQITNQISQNNLIAPIDGVITETPMEKGEIVSSSQTVVSMNSLSNFEIESDIPETDIAKVAPEQKVDITLDAFGDQQIWQGRVTKINPAQTVVQGVVYYVVSIGFSINNPQIKAGMTANLDIETGRHDNALLIPARAITQDGSKSVKILDNSQTKQVEIETGIKDAQGNVEVTAGLKEGQQLVIEKTQ